MYKIKLIPIAVLLISVMLFLTSCGEPPSDVSKKDIIEIHIASIDGGEEDYLIYQDVKYVYVVTSDFYKNYRHKFNLVHRDFDDEQDVLLSWTQGEIFGYYVGYVDMYYSYTSENPLFIYNRRLREVYFREDYNPAKDLFVVEGTEDEIIWEDAFCMKTQQKSEIFKKCTVVYLCSKQLPRIKVKIYLVNFENQWYMSTIDFCAIWTPSDEFMSILYKNGIIQSQ